jgi:4-amino-4-deoxy-L-arabinose transferase-like glycosyltransferase
MENRGITSKFRLRFQDRHKWMIAGLLLAVLLLGAFLRFYRLGESGIGNTYYAATVKSMLVSWKNFFFVAFEPGGSVSVDKPPLGFWVQALSAYFLGVNGFALALPNAISGVLSIFLIYKLIRRPFGPWAGLVAALTLAVMPVAISTERNNTIDGLLVLVLLLAALAFLHAVRTGKVRWLFLGAFIVGLGFNIKMLQAYLPLPAFYALYLFGAKQKWGEKVLHLAMATVILLIFSFSWAVAVDLTPASNRPYVDSTSNNTVMELIFGHNGIERLTNLRQGMGFAGGPDQPPMQDEFSSAIPQDRLPDGEMVKPPGGRNIPRNELPQPPAGQPFAPGGLPQPPARQGVPQAFGDGHGHPNAFLPPSSAEGHFTHSK